MEEGYDVPLSVLQNIDKSRFNKILGAAESKVMNNVMAKKGMPTNEDYLYDQEEGYEPQEPIYESSQISDEKIKNSGLPDAIKKIMLESKPDMTAGGLVSNELPPLNNVRKDLFNPQQKQQRAARPQQQSGISEDQIRQIVSEELNKLLLKEYTNEVKKRSINETVAILKKKGLLK